jgi:hypothetical protein
MGVDLRGERSTAAAQTWRRTAAAQMWRRTLVLPVIAALAALALLAPLRAADHNFLWKAAGRGGVL